MLSVKAAGNGANGDSSQKKHTCVSTFIYSSYVPLVTHLFLSDLYRCATMKPHAPVTPPGRGQTVACLTHLKSLRTLRTKDPRVGFHLFQPLAPDRMNNTHVYVHSFDLAKIHSDSYSVYVVLQYCNVILSHTVRSESAQILRGEFHRCTRVVKTSHVKKVTEGE